MPTTDQRIDRPTVLLVDDNGDVLLFLERLMTEAGWRLLTFRSVQLRVFNYTARWGGMKRSCNSEHSLSATFSNVAGSERFAAEK
jgi:hypothetical protein